MLSPMKIFWTIVVSLFAACGLSSCSNDNGTSSGKQSEVLAEAMAHNLDLFYYYNSLTSATADTVYHQINALAYGKATQQQLNTAAATFLRMRLLYEQTEAFFLGPNSHFDIDADINKWPLDHQAFDQLMTSGSQLETVSGLPSSIVGFHGLEYILYREGKVRNVSDLTAREIQYAQLLIADLRLRLAQVRCGWTAADTELKQLLSTHALPYTAPDESDYRTYMLKAYTTKQLAAALLTGDHGMGGLSDEIAYTKLHRPYSSDSTYIESPYSMTSLDDLERNLASISNVWYGAPLKKGTASFHSYFASYAAAEGQKVEEALVNCKKSLEAIPKPFVSHCKDASVPLAIKAFEQLTAALSDANDYIQNNEK